MEIMWEATSFFRGKKITNFSMCQSWPDGRAMAWKLDAVSSEYLPKYPTPSGQVVVWGTWLSCLGT
ncbi:hypothetical protein OUZ56_022563 [Daphnia magna]|uniref:Uncharacterized protein n=1 Tax=Daphnia magna TaxID=35525 RepID=A0ABR0AWU5_9CRUS|nr:hypothetical protein OUZ56_022563 [Daphnia magna]